MNTPKFALLVVLVGLVAGVKLVEVTQGASIRWRPVALPLLALLIPLTTSWLANEHRSWTLLGEYSRLQGFFPYLLFGSLALLVADAFRDDIGLLTRFLAGLGGVVGLLAILQVLGWDPIREYTFSPIGGAVTTVGNPNFTGGLLAILLPISMAVANEQRQGIWIAATLGTAGGVVASNSQGAWVAALVAILLMARFLKDSPVIRNLFSVSAVGVVVVALLAGAAPLVSDMAKDLSPNTAELRGLWWQAALKMGMASPVWGHGPNAFGYMGVQFRSLEEAERTGFEFPDDPHSLPLSLFANAGILGLIGFLVLAAWTITRLRDSGADILQASVAVAGVAYIAQSLVSIDELSLRVVAWASIGAMAVSSIHPSAEEAPRKKARRKRRAQASPIQRPALALIALAAPIAAGAFAVLFVRADAAMADARALLGRAAFDDAIVEHDRSLSPRNEIEYRHQFGFGLAQQVVRRQQSQYIPRIEEALAVFPSFPDLPAIRDAGRAFLALGSLDASHQQTAADLYESAIEIDDKNVELTSEALVAFTYAMRFSLAIDTFEELSQSEGLTAAGMAAVAISYWEEDQPDAARESLERASALDPSDPIVKRASEVISEDSREGASQDQG